MTKHACATPPPVSVGSRWQCYECSQWWVTAYLEGDLFWSKTEPVSDVAQRYYDMMRPK